MTSPTMKPIGLGDKVHEATTLEVRPKEYLPLLWIVFAALIGVSLLCGAAAMGVNDINQAAQAGTPAVGVVDFFVANINTVVVETVEAFSEIVSAPTFTPTPIFTNTSVPFTPSVTATHTRRPTSTSFVPNRTVIPPSQTASSIPTNTPTNTATATFTPTKTLTATSTPTFTFTPTNTPTATKTPSNTPTDTPIPSDTPLPSPTDTPVPTDTPIPTDTAIPTDTVSAPAP